VGVGPEFVHERCLRETGCFEDATRGGDTIPVRYREAVSAPWASVTAVPSVVESSAFLYVCGVDFFVTVVGRKFLGENLKICSKAQLCSTTKKNLW